LIANELDLKGASRPDSLIQPALSSGAQILFASFSWICGEKRFTKEDLVGPMRYPWMIVLELTANALYYAGVYLVGSGLNTVLYSTVCIFTAFFSSAIYKVHISRLKWFSILIILISISLSALGQTHIEGVSTTQTLIGSIVGISAAVVYGLDYVLSEKLLLKRYTPLSTAFFFWPILVLYGLWVGFYVGFQWKSKVQDPIEKVDPNYNLKDILFLYGLFFISCGTHQISFYLSLNGGKVASVATAVNKCLQAALLFVSSDLLFCPHYSWNQGKSDLQEKQCISKWKFAGFCGVLFGVFLFSLDGICSMGKKDLTLSEQFLAREGDETIVSPINGKRKGDKSVN